MAESRLLQRLRSQGLSPVYEGKPVKDTDISLIDADTPVVDGESIRLPGGVDAPEVSHFNPTTFKYNRGEVGGQEITDRTAEIIKEGNYTKKAPEYTSGGKQLYGAYGRPITNLANEQGQGLSEKLLYTGIVSPNAYADDYSQTISSVGRLDRVQRKNQGKQNRDDLLIESLNEIENRTRKAFYGDEVGAKGTAATEKLFDPRYHSGTSFTNYNRNFENEIKGFQLDDAWDVGSDNAWQAVYTSAGIIGQVTGWDTLEQLGFGNAERLERKIKDAGYLRNTNMFDSKTGEYTLEGFTGFMDWASTNLVQSLPIMGTTMVSVLAAPATWGTSLSVPVSIYTGMNYNDQAEGEKDISKALSYGALQAALDVVGVKLGGAVVKNFFTSPAARKSVVAKVASANNIKLSTAENMLTKAMRGQYSKAMDLTKAQLLAMVKTNPQIAAGLGISMGVNGTIEGVTEAGQEILSVMATSGDLDWENPEFRNRLLNAFAAGGTLGAGFGGFESGTLAEINLKSGLSKSTTKTLNQISADIDNETMGPFKENNGLGQSGALTSEQAFDWVQNNSPEDKEVDPYNNSNLYERAKEKRKNKDGFIDSSFKKFRSLYAGNVEQSLRPFQGNGPYMDRLISPFLGNRAGPTIEKERQLIIGKVADKAEFSERIAVGALGYRNAQEFAEFHLNEKRNPFISKIVQDATKSGVTVNSLIENSNYIDSLVKKGLTKDSNLSTNYIKFLEQVVSSNRKANKLLYDTEAGTTTGDSFNILERGFSPQEIYNNQAQFESDLINLKKIPKSEAERISTILTNTETIIEPEDIYAEIANDSSSLKYSQVLKDLKKDKRFSKYLENNVFNNIAQNGLKLAARHTNNKYFGTNGYLIADGLSKAVKNGDITSDQSIDAAVFFRDYQKMLSGTYNVVTNKTYNRMMNIGTTYASLNFLELAAVSSFPEFATVLLHNNANSEPLNVLARQAKEAGKEIANSVRELSSNLTGGHVSMKEYGNNRAKLRQIGFMSEQTAPAARVGAEYSPNQARVMQMFFNAIQLNSSTNFFRGVAMSNAEDHINSYIAQAAVHYPIDRDSKGKLLEPNKLYSQAVRELDDLGIPGEAIATMAYQANVVKLDPGANNSLKKSLDQYIDIGILNYVDQRIMTPRKGNRAKWLSDPRFRLVATFTGYISTATTTLLPKIYKNLGGKDRLPVERVNSIKTIVAMMVMAYLAIGLKSAIKGIDEDEEQELEPKDFLRILSQSGLTGLADRPLQALMPFSNPRTNIGDAFNNINMNLGSLANQIIGQSPIIANIDQGIIGATRSAIDPKDNNALRNLTSTVPLVDTLLKERLTPYQMKEK